MQLFVRVVGRSLLARASVAAAILAILGLLATTSIGMAVVKADTPTPHPLKAVFISGPSSSLTSQDLTDATNLANVAQSLGMDVRRVFFPHATWANVLANIQGANLVVYMGHGYGWPSPYTSVLTESRQDGMGLNTFDGSGPTQYTYYGADVLRQYVTLAPNAIVFLNHLCYSAGNGEPGMAFPTPAIAEERVDNMASGWLSIGAKAVFAYGEQLFTKSLNTLMDTTQNPTMQDIFQLPPPPKHVGEYWGWVGTDPQTYASVRTPGATNFLDPDLSTGGDGYYRAVSGNLGMTTSQWRLGPDAPGAPTMKNLSASTDGQAQLVGSSGTLFTPNGDGSTDTVTFNYTVNKETFVDWQVENSSSTEVRDFSSWSPTGAGSAVWDGKDDNGSYVPDGTYTLVATPSSRGGVAGNPLSTTVQVLTTMANPAATPNLFYATDTDNLAPTTTLSVNLTQPATFSWSVVDSNGNTVRTKYTNASVGAGTQSWTWDGKDGNGSYVAQGTYYSVMTAATADGTYTQRVAVDDRAFRLLTSVAAPFTRGTKVKLTIYSAEPLLATAAKPKVKVTLPGMAAKTYGTTKQSDGGFYVTVNLPTTAQAGTAQFHVTGTDTNSVAQFTDYFFQLN